MKVYRSKSIDRGGSGMVKTTPCSNSNLQRVRAMQVGFAPVGKKSLQNRTTDLAWCLDFGLPLVVVSFGVSVGIDCKHEFI